MKPRTSQRSSIASLGRSRPSRPVAFVAFVLAFGAADAGADSPAAIAPAETRMEESLSRFAQDWIAKAREFEERERQKPSIRPGGRTPLVTYRGVGERYTIELRSTGHPESPYVGLLRYTELLYRCTDATTGDCRVASSTPVTEIFRLQDGRWGY